MDSPLLFFKSLSFRAFRLTPDENIRYVAYIHLVSGFWHGANWTFIVWGALNAVYFLPLLLTNKNRKNIGVVAQSKYLPSLNETMNILITFGLTLFGWIFFRAENIWHAMNYMSEVFSLSAFTIPYFSGRRRALLSIILVFLFLLIEWHGRDQEYAIANFGIEWKKPIRWGFYYFIAIAIFLFSGQKQEFIYFQF